MSPFDDLPRRPRSHEVEEAAIVAFQSRLNKSGVFVLQTTDAKDYGTDCQIEVIVQGQATNVRVHVQLKGTEKALNANGSVSVDVSRTNLNYLLAQPYSFYVCYHLPTASLRVAFVDEVLRKYEHGGGNWTEQHTLTVSFIEELTVDRLHRIADLTRADSTSSRDRRIQQSRDDPSRVASSILRSIPEVHVPEDPERAGELLAQLYKENADLVISGSFEAFAAVLGADSDAFGPAYMAETNLGLAKVSSHPERIQAAIPYFVDKVGDGRVEPGSLAYTIGNAHSALGDEEAAKQAYLVALFDPGVAELPGLAAQVHKNLGTSYERLGDQDKAVEHYHKALRLDPDLAEAHYAMGNHHFHLGQFKDALAHFDRVVFADEALGKGLGVAGWRANALFNLGDGRGAFREINTLIGASGRLPWVWPWCARQVASFGRANVYNAIRSASFWERYIAAFPGDGRARVELLLTKFYLRSTGHDIGRFGAFREEFDRHIAHVGEADQALPWDRLGHWAQDDDDWEEAERCFRKAYELEGGHFGYCLGTALNFLGRHDEALPIVFEQAHVLQPDAMSWFQLAIAYEGGGKTVETIAAYVKAIELDPDYDLAMFNLGGAYWNTGDIPNAVATWMSAIERFPDHELTAKLRREMPTLFA